MTLPAARSPHRAWIEIDHAALVGNLAIVRRLAGEQRAVIAVVKANAYGHGAIEVSRTLLRHGVERLAVATLGEGLALRAAGIEAPILLLWGLGSPEVSPALAADLERLRSSVLEMGGLVERQLSKAIGAAASTLNDRIKRLVAQGVISGFHARLSPEALGLHLLAFIFVGWSNPKVEPVFLKKIKASSAVLECHHVTGPWNYLLKVRVETTRELERFLAETVKAVTGVDRTETMIILSSAKETWALDVPKQET